MISALSNIESLSTAPGELIATGRSPTVSNGSAVLAGRRCSLVFASNSPACVLPDFRCQGFPDASGPVYSKESRASRVSVRPGPWRWNRASCPHRSGQSRASTLNVRCWAVCNLSRQRGSNARATEQRACRRKTRQVFQQRYTNRTETRARRESPKSNLANSLEHPAPARSPHSRVADDPRLH